MGVTLYYDSLGRMVGASTDDARYAGLIQTPTGAGLAHGVSSTLDEEAVQRADSAWRGLLFTVVGALISAVVSCLPMWQRILMHPNVVEVHMKRARTTALAGGLLILPLLIGAPLGICTWNIGLFSGTGIGLLCIGLATMIVGIAQRRLSNRYPEFASGNGYGLFNLFHLLLGVRPNHFWTVLQDAAIVAAVVAVFVLGVPPQERLIGLGISAVLVGFFLGYTWYCQGKFSDVEAISFT